MLPLCCKCPTCPTLLSGCWGRGVEIVLLPCISFNQVQKKLPFCLRRACRIWLGRSCLCWWIWSVCCCPCHWSGANQADWRSYCALRSLWGIGNSRGEEDNRHTSALIASASERVFWLANKWKRLRLTCSVLVFAALCFLAHLTVAVGVVLG